MKSSKGISVLFGGVSLATVAFFTVLLSGGILGGNTAEANQPPPPPTYYTLTVNKSGGDSTCEVRIDSPGPSAWTTGSVQGSFLWGTAYEPAYQITCPSQYEFEEWESNDEDLDGWRGNRDPDFTLTKNTTAKAVFKPAILPDAESTIWHDHYTQSPHNGDMYWHQVSSSSNPTHSFAGLVINEDFLTSEMDTSSCSMTLTQQQKVGFQNSWDGDWAIDNNNFRKELSGRPSDDKYDAHGFNPNSAPWNQIQPNEVFRIKQRMRVKGCPSVNNQGPWFATHAIEFKVIQNTQLAQKEVFAKKSGVQGTGDPSF